jgi:hypothetical protein
MLRSIGSVVVDSGRETRENDCVRKKNSSVLEIRRGLNPGTQSCIAVGGEENHGRNWRNWLEALIIIISYLFMHMHELCAELFAVVRNLYQRGDERMTMAAACRERQRRRRRRWPHLKATDSSDNSDKTVASLS